MKHIVLGTSGHIDHGKTSLVQALTGVNTDRLAEEKKRGITIELGFAPIELGPDLKASIIDVPGHERLVRTMVAGAGGIDVGVLVVAADDGLMPQTQEHLDILRLLGVPAGVTVITKADLADDELLELITEELLEALEGSVFAESPILHVSSKTGKGIPELRSLLTEMGSKVQTRTHEGAGFLPLDRVFVKEGYGTIGTGTTLRGSFNIGDSVQILGDEAEPVAELKIRGLQSLGSAQETVVAGMRTAINLTGKDTDAVKRGMTVATSGAFCSVDSVIAWVEILGQARSLEEEGVTAHLGTGEREAHCIPLGCDKIEAGESGSVLLRFDRPIPSFAGQKLVLRRPGIHGQATIAGGEVLDPEPPRGKGSVSLAASQAEFLRGDPKQRLRALARESRSAGISRLGVTRRLPPGETKRSAEFLEKKGHLVRIPGPEERWVDGELVGAIVSKVVSMVSGHHDKDPMSEGMVEAEITTQLPPPEQHLAQLVVDRAVSQKKLVRIRAVIAIPGRGSAISPEDQSDMNRIQAVLDKGQLTPPTDKLLQEELGFNEKRFQQLLGFMRRAGSIRKVAQGQHYPATVLSDLQIKIVAHLKAGEELSASGFKDLAGGISRKYAIPLLEYYDREKITLRAGNFRKLHPSQKQ